MTDVAMVLSFVYLTGLHLGAPGYYAYTLWRARKPSRRRWLLQAASAAALVSFVVLVGRWDMIGYPLRFVVPGVVIAGAIFGWSRARCLPVSAPGKRLQLLADGIGVIAVIALNALAIRGMTYREEPVRLAWPLRGGGYYVAHGGAHTFLNYHYAYPPQRYALDISRLNSLGLRASGLFPTALDRYVIYGQFVYSPCDGKVIAARDGLPDQAIGASDPAHPAGNHVVVACRGTEVELVHLQRGSVRVVAGQSVRTSDLIGAIGNSGNTTEPHLHIHAGRGEQSVPILFDGEFLVRNDIVSSESARP